MRNLFIRILVASIFAPLLIFLAYQGRFYFLFLVEVLIFLGLFEFHSIARAKEAELPLFLLIPLGLLIGWFSFLGGEKYVLLILFLAFLSGSFYQILKNGTKKASSNIAFFILGTIYVPFFFSHLILIRQLPNYLGLEYKIGGLWVIFILVCVWFCDTLAYFIGAPLGKYQLAPNISPKKTIEGAIGGVVGALGGAIFSYYLFLNFISIKHLLLISFLIGIVGQIGDLMESSFKREVGLKDSSTIIPGHGGILDRFDSLLFVSPLVYYYLRFFIYN